MSEVAGGGATLSLRQHAFRDLEELYGFVRRRTPVLDKGDLIAELSRGRRVLDLGCVNHRLEREGAGPGAWLHERIRAQAAEVVGLDILESAVEVLRSRGYRAVAADAQDFDLGETFDVVVAGDLVEHLSNIGSFFVAVERHMRPDSLFVLTTPNPFFVGRFVTAFARNFVSVNREHTVWMDPKVMYQAVSRSGLEIVAFSWLGTPHQDLGIRGLRGWLARRFVGAVSRLRPVMRGDYAVVLRRRAA
jgi:2-polyprenyl-3-methyl-5-hydroxy-6-metoxy-1,4-benzoquinol methylase